jgi:hypothetical protein
MLMFLWMLFSFGSVRRYPRWSAYRELRDDWDQRAWWSDRGRPDRGGPYRGRGPRNYRRSDARIVEDVSDRLMMEPEIDATDMEVQVKDGTVSLTGAVPTRFEKRLSEFVAESVPGVRDVDNKLEIGARSVGSSGQREHAFSS